MSWVGNCKGEQCSPFEYTIDEVGADYSHALIALPSLFELINGLSAAYLIGVTYLPALPRSQNTLYEQTDEEARISVVSLWKDPRHAENPFSRSVYAFECDNGEVVVNEKIGGGNCYNCQPSEPKAEGDSKLARFYIHGQARDFGVERCSVDSAREFLREF